MTIRANKFTPEVLLSAPRRSSATPNSDGSLALFSVSTYSFESHSKTSEIRILDIATGLSTLLTNDSNASEPTWLGGGNEVVWLQGGENGITKLVLGDVRAPEKSLSTVATFGGPVSNLKICPLESNTFAVALTGQATSSGELFNPATAEKPASSGKVYTSLFVRQWDSYVQDNKSTIFYGLLSFNGGKCNFSNLSNILNTKKGYNPLKLETPVPPFGGSDNFDISKSGVVFIAKDPKLNLANHTKTDLYFVPLKTFTESDVPVPQVIQTGKLRGYCGTPLFSPDAKSLAFTRMKSDQYESDKPRLLTVPNINDLSNVQEFFESETGEGNWDRSPSISCWSQDGKELYLTAEEYGRGKLWKMASVPSQDNALPTRVIEEGAVSDVKCLAKGSDKLFITSTSLIDNSIYSILDPSDSTAIHKVSSNSKNGKAFGLSQRQVDEFWYHGAGDYHVHALVMKPSNFDKKKKYPLAYLIHGGPQSAWLESWSTRWNPAIFAEAGYVVVTPNPTGSTGYGMDLQNGIQNEWGGRPYIDLVIGFEYIEQNLPYVDASRAVALGASYGGFMMNWIQGHPLGRKFKALVTHDGVFSTLNQYASDELFFPQHDFGGTLWENRAAYEQWDPARFLESWATPHLIIHNELDYRLPISEGLAPFNVLQTKGIPSKFLTFSDENHFVLKPENSFVWHKEVLGWINKYSGVEKDADIAEGVAKLAV